ncbi:MAG: Monomeric sarcosine oxidase [Alphaproteobacteria bacterium MarineAlpha6_Bin4]|nr:MAG: Monomeric sarcosine oxidase [Alphaproteobacteria bacterium MarineAlpha6_Bin4]
MNNIYHTVVIGGGCLGVASAISLARKLNSSKTGTNVCILEKSVLAGGISSRHSGIIRSANASIQAATFAEQSNEMWRNIKDFWGIDIIPETPGAIWIARNDKKEAAKTWIDLEKNLNKSNIDFYRVKSKEIKELTNNFIRINEEHEIYFHEPNAMLFDPIKVRNAMYHALDINNVKLKENTRVTDFELLPGKKIKKIKTNNGPIFAENVINAAGGWSPQIFDTIGVKIPVSLQPVYVSNWLISNKKLPMQFPIIADYINLSYFRTWKNGELHIHQPRDRSPASIARSFAEEPTSMKGADVFFDSSNYTASYSETNKYAEMIRDRFPNAAPCVFNGGYITFFDITPDLKFILGKDKDVKNLYHCLGAGQAFKYAPIFGELLANLILGKKTKIKNFNLDEFSIKRFYKPEMKKFWGTVQGSQNTLKVREQATA